MGIQSGYSRDTVGIQGGYSEDTGRIQSGYSRVQWGYREDTVVVEVVAGGENDLNSVRRPNNINRLNSVRRLKP